MSGDLRATIPGHEGSIGPGRGQYGKPHVYARDVSSGAGNCVCGRDLHHGIHTEAAPGVPIPGRPLDDGSVTITIRPDEGGFWTFDFVDHKPPAQRDTGSRPDRHGALAEAVNSLYAMARRG